MIDFGTIENEIKQGTYCALWDNPDYMWEAITINPAPDGKREQQQEKTNKMAKKEQITPESNIEKLTYDICKSLIPENWEYITSGFKRDHVLMVLKQLETNEQQTKVFNMIIDSHQTIHNNGFLYSDPDWKQGISLSLALKEIPTKKHIPQIPTNADGVDYTKFAELIKNYDSTVDALSQELEANRKRESSVRELASAIAQLQATMEKAGEESAELKQQNEALKATLQEKDNEIRQKDEQIEQFKAESNKETFNKKEIVNEVVTLMVKEAEEWEDLEERKAVSSIILATLTEYLTPNVKKAVKALKHKKPEPPTPTELVLTKNVTNEIHEVHPNAVGVKIEKEDKK